MQRIMFTRTFPLFVLLVSFFPGPIAHAQHSGIGIKGGALMSDTRSVQITTNSIPGATAGLYFPLRAGDRLEVQPELLVTAMGAGFTLPDGERSTLRTLYVQLPVSAKVYFGNTLNVQAGILMGRLILAQQDAPNGSEDVTESYNTWDHGFVLGLGVDLITGLDMGVRYYNGMRPILKEDVTPFLRNRAYMLTVGYRLGRLKAPSFQRKRG